MKIDIVSSDSGHPFSVKFAVTQDSGKSYTYTAGMRSPIGVKRFRDYVRRSPGNAMKYVNKFNPTRVNESIRDYVLQETKLGKQI